MIADLRHGCVVLLLLLFGFNPVSRCQQSAASEKTIEVRELVDHGTKYSDRPILVRGCLILEFEIRVLQPCDSEFSQFSKYTVWVDEHDNNKGTLSGLTGNREHPLVVVLRGQFEESKFRKYGHLNFYKRLFISQELVRQEGRVR